MKATEYFTKTPTITPEGKEAFINRYAQMIVQEEGCVALGEATAALENPTSSYIKTEANYEGAELASFLTIKKVLRDLLDTVPNLLESAMFLDQMQGMFFLLGDIANGQKLSNPDSENTKNAINIYNTAHAEVEAEAEAANKAKKIAEAKAQMKVLASMIAELGGEI
jgi:aminoglycoside/choline kinase family phosphotransferase